MAESLKKPLVGLLIFSVLMTIAALFYYPKQAKAQTTCAGAIASSLGLSLGSKIIAVPTSDTLTEGYTGGDFVSTCIIKPLIIAMAQRILANITNSLVTWIQSGFKGNPTFVTNVDDMFSNSANQAIGQFINGTSLKFLCQPFSFQIRIALATSFSSQPYQGCTLKDIDKNIENFGHTEQAWNSWLNITTVPANNQYGAYIQASGILSDQINAQLSKISNETNRNGGFLDYKVCDAIDEDEWAATSPDLTKNPPDPSTLKTTDPLCGHSHTTTPGKTISDAIAGKYSAEFNQIGVADDINQIMGALVNELVSKTLTGPGGLLGGSTQSVSNTQNLSVTVSGQSASNAALINTLSQIAKMFGVSVNTIIWANDITGPIHVGDKLVILPITGVEYTVKITDLL